MPTYISKDGIWYPGKEKVALVNRSGKTKKIKGTTVKAGEPYIYEGADRASLFELWQIGQETMGSDFRVDPEMIMRVKQLGFSSMDEYLAFTGYDKEKVEKEFKEKASVVNKHEIKEGVETVNTLGGGVDTTGQSKNRYGGFGEPKEG